FFSSQRQSSNMIYPCSFNIWGFGGASRRLRRRLAPPKPQGRSRRGPRPLLDLPNPAPLYKVQTVYMKQYSSIILACFRRIFNILSSKPIKRVKIFTSELWYSHAASTAAPRSIPYRGHMIESRQLSHTPPVELRYFAAPRDDWELLLLRARQLGADTIASRVPWAWHAPAPDVLDFDGATDKRRDLVGFVRLCSRLGLRVLLDPGPIHGNL